METQEYYNAKPSKISNIGKDVAGAKRMHFDTYETVEERQAREVKKATDKNIALVKTQLKNEVLSDCPSVETIMALKSQLFTLEHGFNPNNEDARTILRQRRSLVTDTASRASFNKTINSFNRLNREARQLEYNPKYYIQKMAAKYASKKTFTEQSGVSYNWNQFKLTESNPTVVNFLADRTSAVQFGNSVTDNERAYICSELQNFIESWSKNGALNGVDLKPVNWSFGARGKAGSVAYYQSCGKVISVNRNNIGSLIHELGHFIDDMAGGISRKISYETVNKYRESIKEGLDPRSLSYYCKRCEIFARAFEAYCYKIHSEFQPFAQSGFDYLPELNEELIGLIRQALGK